MQLKTILNRLYRHKSFVYGEPEFSPEGEEDCLRIPVTPRANGHPICSGCQRCRPGYDQLPERTFRFVPLWGLAVYLVYAMRRVSCPECGVRVEEVP